MSPGLKRDLKKLHTELIEGVIQPLREDAPDADFWRTVSKPYIGRSWLDVPWYWAETYFYRRILEIFRYFQIGAWHERDPFAPQKDAELKPDAAPARVQKIIQSLQSADSQIISHQSSDIQLPPSDIRHPTSAFQTLFHAALWGNRVDLSYNVEQQHGRADTVHAERSNLLIDDADSVYEYLTAQKINNLIYIADNAGTELALDLAFIDHLLQPNTVGSRPLVEKVTLHLKPQPFYVSDAMPQDVERTLKAFDTANEQTQALASRLRAHAKSKRLQMRVHWFYPTSLHYYETPDDLYKLYQTADFLILKGDVNYRRAVGDAHWNPTITFEHATRYFPTPLVALRTLKSDTIVGLTAAQVRDLDHADSQWRVNGKRGVAQANLNPGA